jgi:hypothetical protein
MPKTNKTREQIRSFLWRKKLKRPVALTHLNGQLVFAIAEPGNCEEITYAGEGERRYTIKPTDIVHTITFDKAVGFESDLAAAMLQQAISSYLKKNRQLVGGQRTTQFFLTSPDRPYVTVHPGHQNSNRYRPSAKDWPITNQRASLPSRSAQGASNNHKQSVVDIHRGFSYRVIQVEDVGLCLVLDVLTTYVGNQTLAEYIELKQEYQDIEEDQGFTRWVLDYGHEKQLVYLLRVTDQTIEQVLLKDGRSLYQFLYDERPSVRNLISRGDLAADIVYRTDDRNDEAKHYSAAVTLLKPKYTTQSSLVRALNDTAAFPSAERLRRIEETLRYIRGVKFAGADIIFGTRLETPRQLLPRPALVFGPNDQPTMLEPEAPTEYGGPQERDARRRWGSQKMAMLKKQGPYITSPFTNAFLVYPASLETGGLIDTFGKLTMQFCEDYGKVDVRLHYSSYRDQASSIDIIAKLRGIEKQQNADFILLALPDNLKWATQVYAGAKTQLNIPSKCFSGQKLRKEARDTQRLRNYTERNALAMLVEKGSRPWGLADHVYYEVQFGFGIARTKHGGLLGATAILNTSGTDIRFRNDNIDSRARIPAKDIKKFVGQHLEDFYSASGRVPKSIMFQRDGRLLDVERSGMQAGLDKFLAAHPGQPEPKWVAVSIVKSTSVPLRLFRNPLRPNQNVETVFSGSYFLQNSKSAYLVTAGDPSLRQGTPHPIQVEIVECSDNHSADISHVLRDVFWLSQLNWNSPEIDINLPITLRFTDYKLERYALEYTEDEEDEEDAT